MKKLLILLIIGCISLVTPASAMENRKELEFHGDTPLHLAVLYGHEEIANMLISGGANPNSTNGVGETPLHKAVQAQLPKMVHLLATQKTTRVDARNERGGLTPLFYAIWDSKPNLEIIRLLLENKADPNLRLKTDETLLSLATRRGAANIVALLLEFGADPNEPAEQPKSNAQELF